MSQIEKVSLLADLNAAKTEISKKNQTAVKSLSNALGAIYDEIEAMTSPNTDQVLKLVDNDVDEVAKSLEGGCKGIAVMVRMTLVLTGMRASHG